MNGLRSIMIALGIGVLVGAGRWILECKFVASLVSPDPQIPIWIMISTVTSIFIAATIACAAWLSWLGLGSKSKFVRFISFIPLVLLLGWYSIGFFDLLQMRSALVDSANPNTGSNRLRELASYKKGPGYEIDNRIAEHRNTPPDVLRVLHGRPNQSGTERHLAENPKTPDDILHSIAKLAEQQSDLSDYYWDALKRNPRYDEVFKAERTSDAEDDDQGQKENVADPSLLPELK